MSFLSSNKQCQSMEGKHWAQPGKIASWPYPVFIHQ